MSISYTDFNMERYEAPRNFKRSASPAPSWPPHCALRAEAQGYDDYTPQSPKLVPAPSNFMAPSPKYAPLSPILLEGRPQQHAPTSPNFVPQVTSSTSLSVYPPLAPSMPPVAMWRTFAPRHYPQVTHISCAPYNPPAAGPTALLTAAEETFMLGFRPQHSWGGMFQTNEITTISENRPPTVDADIVPSIEADEPEPPETFGKPSLAQAVQRFEDLRREFTDTRESLCVMMTNLANGVRLTETWDSMRDARQNVARKAEEVDRLEHKFNKAAILVARMTTEHIDGLGRRDRLESRADSLAQGMR